MKEEKNAKITKNYIKNVIKIKKSTEKRISKRDFNNQNIVEKCNKKIVKQSKKDIVSSTYYIFKIFIQKNWKLVFEI